MIKTLGLLALLLIVGVLVVAAFRPDTFRVERRLRIQAPPATIYGLIQDLHQFNRWNPWLRKEPSAKGEYGGPAAGVGARNRGHARPRSSNRCSAAVGTDSSIAESFKAASPVASSHGNPDCAIAWLLISRPERHSRERRRAARLACMGNCAALAKVGELPGLERWARRN